MKWNISDQKQVETEWAWTHIFLGENVRLTEYYSSRGPKLNIKEPDFKTKRSYRKFENHASTFGLKKDGGDVGEGTAADSLRIMLDKAGCAILSRNMWSTDFLHSHKECHVACKEIGPIWPRFITHITKLRKTYALTWLLLSNKFRSESLVITQND